MRSTPRITFLQKNLEEFDFQKRASYILKIMEGSRLSKSSLTQDAFLGGKVYLFQPKSSYRAGIDAVFLSASITPFEGQSILDVGCGVGAASLLMLHRAQEHLPFSVVGLEKSEELSKISLENAQRNKLQEHFKNYCGDLKHPPCEILEKSFDHVLTNPPFFEGTELSPYPLKAQAHHLSGVSFEEWICFCIKRLKPFGMLTLIIPPQKLQEVLRACEGRVGNLHLFPLWPRANMPAKRLIVQGMKSRKTPLKLLQGLILHEEGREFTKEAVEILFHGKSLTFV